ncbi:MAG: hypothetical protein K6F05_02850 [Succinivibrio sp.]|nr:hypothetical protein [Succinivibrio sp.]
MKLAFNALLLSLCCCQAVLALESNGKLNPQFQREVEHTEIAIPEANAENCGNTAVFSETLEKIMNISGNAQTTNVYLKRLSQYEEQCELIKKDARSKQHKQAMEARAQWLKARDERRRQQAIAKGLEMERLQRSRNSDLDR